MAKDRFAFGQNVVDDCTCPALEAGVQVTGEVESIVHIYDDKVRAQTLHEQGTIPKKMARQFWQKAMDNYQNERKSEHWKDQQNYVPTLEKAQIVKEEAFRD